jgi:hypothetical protein
MFMVKRPTRTKRVRHFTSNESFESRRMQVFRYRCECELEYRGKIRIIPGETSILSKRFQIPGERGRGVCEVLKVSPSITGRKAIKIEHATEGVRESANSRFTPRYLREAPNRWRKQSSGARTSESSLRVMPTTASTAENAETSPEVSSHRQKQKIIHEMADS